MISSKFHMLTVLQYSNTNNRSVFYRCQSNCINIKKIQESKIRSGNTKSCGCYRKQRFQKWKSDHSGSKHRAWSGVGDMPGSYWVHIKAHSESRGIPLELSKEEAWEKFEKQGGKCALTGVDID